MQKIDMSIAIVCMINQTALNMQLNKMPLTTLNQTDLINGPIVAFNNATTVAALLSNQTIPLDNCASSSSVVKKATHVIKNNVQFYKYLSDSI